MGLTEIIHLMTHLHLAATSTAGLCPDILEAERKDGCKVKRPLRTVREFMLLSVPIPQEQSRMLYTSLKQEGCKEPIIIWGDIIIDGHKRYHYCAEEGIDYRTEEKSFSSTDEAASWICRQRLSQFGNKTAAYRYLVGCQYIALKKIFKELRKEPEEQRKTQLNPAWNRTSLYLSEELCINHTTVESYGRYAADMIQIAGKAKALFDLILAEDIRLSKDKIHAYVNLSDVELQEIYKGLLPKITEKKRVIKNREQRETRNIRNVEDPIPLSMGIKEMPAYDPDMELRSLMLTIQTWMTYIARVEKKTDQATEKAKGQLCRSLILLKKQINEILEVMGYG